MTDRLEKIRELLTRTPNDSFLVYSLAMELLSAGQTDKALEHFRRCIELEPGHIPAHTEAGKALRAVGQLHAAREMFRRGLDLARQQGRTHDADFLRQQLESLPGE